MSGEVVPPIPERKCCACGGTAKTIHDDGTWSCANPECKQFDAWMPRPEVSRG